MRENDLKKLLLLGGSAQQIVAIETAKRLGYYTVLCDYLEDNPGQYVADKFYLISTTNKENILKVAKDEDVDGVIAYASDPAAPTAAYVAEKLGLPTNPYASIETLCNKEKFRTFLQEHGFNTPVAKGYRNKEEAMSEKGNYILPIIIKPVDSSGSKGVTVLNSWDDFSDAIDFAFSFSRTHQIIIEEFIEKKHEYLIGGDIFVVDGSIVLWGLLNCHRDNSVNSLVPVGKSYPLLLDDIDTKAVKNTLQKIVDELGIKFGPINVELVVDKNDKVWPIDIGPRAGGNMIPDMLGIIYGIDIAEMAILAAMGKSTNVHLINKNGYYATHNLHSCQHGIYEKIVFSSELEHFIIKKCFYKKNGDMVEYFDNASKALGIIFMKFDSQKVMNSILQEINKHYKVCFKTDSRG